MKKLILLLALFCCLSTFCQNNVKKTDLLIKEIVKDYNNSNFSAIYNLYANSYKETRSKKQVLAHFTRIRNAFGSITLNKLNSKLTDDRVIYTLSSNTLKEIVISTNKDNKITLLSFNR